jgi:serine/threonine protein kinase
VRTVDGLIGQLLNQRYEILAILGTGGMGIVVQAHDRFLEREVAVKVIRPEYVMNDAFVQMFISEARTLAKLDHPNILPVYDLGMTDHEVYMVTPFATHGTLADHFQHGPMTFYDAERILREVCDAIDYAHRNGVIHLDIKPDNILFDKNDRPLVADFGLSKILQTGLYVDVEPQVGTFDYMAPEQIYGEAAGSYSDIYALGLTLYEMLMGHLPHREPNGVIIYDYTLPLSIMAVIEKATHFDPTQRFQTAKEFCQAYIEAWVYEQTVNSFTDTLGIRTR